MKFLPILAVLGLVAAKQKPLEDKGPSVPGDNILNFCQDPADYILSVSNVDLEPNPPQKGKDLLITATGKLSQPVEEGSYALLEVKFGVITLIKANESLCEQLEKVDRKCPLEEGDLTFERTVTLPTAIPPGKFTVKADVFTPDDQRITCMEAVDVQFK